MAFLLNIKLFSYLYTTTILACNMTTINHIAFLCLSCIMFCLCCTEQKQPTTPSLKVDLENIIELPVDTTRIIHIETNDSSLLYDVCLVGKTDNRYFINSRSFVRAFNEKGEYLFDLSGKGQGPTEYLSVGNLWVEDGNLCLFDKTAQKIMHFSPDGKYLRSDKLGKFKSETGPINLFPAPDSSFLSANSYGGDRNVALFSRWNKNLTWQKTVTGRYVQSSYVFPDVCFTDYTHNRVLYWEAMKDTLFCIEADEIRPLYAFDYGEKAIPSSLKEKTFIEKSRFINENKDKEYAYWARYFQSAGDTIFFSLGYGQEILLCKLDENTQEVKAYTLVFPNNEYRMLFFLKIIGDELLIELENLKNPFMNHPLLLLPLNELN